MYAAAYTHTDLRTHTVTQKAGFTNDCEIHPLSSKLITAPSDNTQAYLSQEQFAVQLERMKFEMQNFF